VAILDVRDGEAPAFREAFAQAEPIIVAAGGYVSHELHRCVEQPSRHVLLVRCQRLEDHTVGFRQSPEYTRWRALLHHFYDPFPTVQHYEVVFPIAVEP
jgi:heme-degrading monooxygenase HmoA